MRGNFLCQNLIFVLCPRAILEKSQIHNVDQNLFISRTVVQIELLQKLCQCLHKIVETIMASSTPLGET